MRQNDATTNGKLKQNMPHQQFQQSFIKAELANAAKAAGTKAKKTKRTKDFSEGLVWPEKVSGYKKLVNIECAMEITTKD